ncbi:hypothetical protein [Streptomyces sp. NPDC046759]|uniref:hypothetical protein n=1 Tax=Streptomyces sp. NPDC046759 TaxID=3155019 RepID=UPI0033CB6559
MLWVMPVTAADMEYRRTHGHEALERLFDEYAIVPTDPRRPSVVSEPRGHGPGTGDRRGAAARSTAWRGRHRALRSAVHPRSGVAASPTGSSERRSRKRTGWG